MIKYHLVRANTDINIRGHKFHERIYYYCRESKDGSQILVQDDLGKWVMMTNNRYATFWSMLGYFKESFTVVDVRYAKNYKELKEKVGSLG